MYIIRVISLALSVSVSLFVSLSHLSILLSIYQFSYPSVYHLSLPISSFHSPTALQTLIIPLSLNDSPHPPFSRLLSSPFLASPRLFSPPSSARLSTASPLDGTRRGWPVPAGVPRRPLAPPNLLRQSALVVAVLRAAHNGRDEAL